MNDRISLKNCPPIMSKEQFYKVCHISKRKAEYLLKSGLVPCENSHRKTHTFKIKKTDVKAYLIDREINPAKYVIPASFENRERKRKRVYLSFKRIDRNAVAAYYNRALEIQPKILDIQLVIAFTGYSRKVVKRWIDGGHLPCFCRIGMKYIILKPDFVAFLASDFYNKILIKSDAHVRHIVEITKGV